MKKYLQKKVFTLIELIIVIAIIAIMAVTAFIMLTKWMGKSRDSRRASDIATISTSLQVYTTDNTPLPLPDSYTGVYDTGNALARYQGSFTDNIASQLSNVSKNIKDPQSGYYGYSVTYDRKQYQLRAFCENTVSYDNTDLFGDKVVAVSQTAKLQGNYGGFIVTATGNIHVLWNVPSLFLFSGASIASGRQYTSGTNNFLQDTKTTDNTVAVQNVDVSGLYNGSSTVNSVLSTIVSTFSGSNAITDISGAKAIFQTSAGGIQLQTNNAANPDCTNGSGYTYSGTHIYNIPNLTNGQSWSGNSLDIVQTSGTYNYKLYVTCTYGSYTSVSETGPTVKSCNTWYSVSGNTCVAMSARAGPGASECSSTRCTMFTDCTVGRVRVSGGDGGRRCYAHTTAAGGYSCAAQRDDGSCPGGNCSACSVN